MDIPSYVHFINICLQNIIVRSVCYFVNMATKNSTQLTILPCRVIFKVYVEKKIESIIIMQSSPAIVHTPQTSFYCVLVSIDTSCIGHEIIMSGFTQINVMRVEVQLLITVILDRELKV